MTPVLNEVMFDTMVELVRLRYHDQMTAVRDQVWIKVEDQVWQQVYRQGRDQAWEQEL